MGRNSNRRYKRGLRLAEGKQVSIMPPHPISTTHRYYICIIIFLLCKNTIVFGQSYDVYSPVNSYLYLKLFNNGHFEYYSTYSDTYDCATVRGKYSRNKDTFSLFAKNITKGQIRSEQYEDSSLHNDSFKVTIIAKKVVPYINFIRINQAYINFNPTNYIFTHIYSDSDTLSLVLPKRENIWPVKYLLISTLLNNYEPMRISTSEANTIIVHINKKYKSKKTPYIYSDKFILSNDTLYRLDCYIDTCQKIPFIKK